MLISLHQIHAGFINWTNQMPLCLVPDASGALAVSAAAPQSCQGFLALTPAEYANATTSVFPPLSIEQGLAISVAIGSLWALAFMYRTINWSITSQSGDS
ncbi:hypothetical protein JFK97_05655 [Chromobacterium phragmitis]|uniref:hypothetical protein n=1 Tax=Chromobacterium amazonense TaxID=1382803 RepID=UPI0021B797F7|nr:hypothetical protein [Chromobacterium amazonense]MBM2883869.1 hypothetical protein [Chromobacterium amazonense]MDE1716495.1 hypothetical protein [Chromobacterium amazonense]